MTTQNTSRVIDFILKFIKGCATWCHLRKAKINNYQFEENVNYSTTLSERIHFDMSKNETNKVGVYETKSKKRKEEKFSA